MININKLSDKDLMEIGNILGYSQSQKRHARRFLLGLNGELKNWEYDETINYGEMKKVMDIIKLLQKKSLL